MIELAVNRVPVGQAVRHSHGCLQKPAVVNPKDADLRCRFVSGHSSGNRINAIVVALEEVTHVAGTSEGYYLEERIRASTNAVSYAIS
jgi:hypothetical protein